MSMKVNKNGKEYDLGFMPEHYPADRVYLDGDTSKTVQDVIDGSVYKKNDNVSGLFYVTGFVEDNANIYALLPLKKSLSDDIASATISLTNTSVYLYSASGYQVLTANSINIDNPTINGFRVKIKFPTNTFATADVKRPCSFAFYASITFS